MFHILFFQNVMGLKWGSYLGSLDKPQPAVSWEWNERSGNGLVVGSLVSLPNGEVFGIGERSCLLIQHSHDKTKGKIKCLTLIPLPNNPMY